jgi:hypothetical protein
VWTLGIKKRCKTRITIIFTYLTVGIEVKCMFKFRSTKQNSVPEFGVTPIASLS